MVVDDANEDESKFTLVLEDESELNDVVQLFDGTGPPAQTVLPSPQLTDSVTLSFLKFPCFTNVNSLCR